MSEHAENVPDCETNWTSPGVRVSVPGPLQMGTCAVTATNRRAAANNNIPAARAIREG